MATIKDVAKRAQVSVATVSRVLNHDQRVKPETKEAVEKVIDELGYSPNLLGRNLRRSSTYNILVLLPTISNQFYSAIIKGIREEMTTLGYNVMIGITDLDVNVEMKHIQLLENKLVDGIIFFTPQIDSVTLTKFGQMYPVIQCSEYVEGAKLSLVSIDNKQAAYDATKYLIQLGNKHIALVTSEKSYTSSKLREEGFREALREHQIPINEELIYYADYTPHSGIEAAKALLLKRQPPTAIFTISDSLAICVIQGLKACGKKVGEDIDVIGFDNTFISKFYEPTITTVSQPRLEMGKQAARLLLNKIQNIGSENETIFLPHELMIRESTK
ncbi:MAG: LacI family DNA-binding transcriptional regulator [Niameybacter sp.]